GRHLRRAAGRIATPAARPVGGGAARPRRYGAAPRHRGLLSLLRRTLHRVFPGDVLVPGARAARPRARRGCTAQPPPARLRGPAGRRAAGGKVVVSRDPRRRADAGVHLMDGPAAAFPYTPAQVAGAARRRPAGPLLHHTGATLT